MARLDFAAGITDLNETRVARGYAPVEDGTGAGQTPAIEDVA